VVLLAACAGGGAGAVDGGHDAHVYLDAPGPDAAISIALNETADTGVNGGATTCIDGNTMTTTHGNTYDNTWWRAFQLSDFPAITGGMHISAIQFGVNSAVAAGTVLVNIGSYTGPVGGMTLDTTMITMMTSVPAAPPDTSAGELMNVPVDVDIPKGGKFVVSIAAPNIVQTGRFYIGGTPSTETQPSYWSSTACNSPTPGPAGGHVIITVAGTH
jgi:hypothetical protein